MLQIRPCDYATAKEFVKDHHRHNRPPAGHKFSIACYEGERMCGVAMVGRPIGRYLDDGLTLEINRCCTDGTFNAGTSLKASNWICDGKAGGTHWTGRRYETFEQIEMPLDEMKIRWHKEL